MLQSAHKNRLLILGFFLVLASLLMMGGPAAAQPAPNPDEPRTAAAPPPDCVEGLVIPGGEFGQVRIRNTCGNTQRVKVIIAWGPDSECFVIESGGTRFHTIDDFTGPFPDPRFDGLVSC